VKQSSTIKITATVILRDNHGGDTKIARCKVPGRPTVQASTTGNTIWCVQNAALKAKGIKFTKSGFPRLSFESSGIKLTNTGPHTWTAEWEEPGNERKI
jgi:hypothetical protein